MMVIRVRRAVQKKEQVGEKARTERHTPAAKHTCTCHTLCVHINTSHTKQGLRQAHHPPGEASGTDQARLQKCDNE